MCRSFFLTALELRLLQLHRLQWAEMVRSEYRSEIVRIFQSDGEQIEEKKQFSTWVLLKLLILTIQFVCQFVSSQKVSDSKRKINFVKLYFTCSYRTLYFSCIQIFICLFVWQLDHLKYTGIHFINPSERAELNRSIEHK